MRVPAGATRWIRVEDASGGRGQLSLAEVSWPGRDVTRQLVLPTLPETWSNPDQVLLRALRDARTGCSVVDGNVRCVEDRARPSEEPNRFDRVVTLSGDETYGATLTALPRPGIDLLVRLQRGLPVSVTGSSTAVPDVRASGLAAADGDLGTTWTPSSIDTRPQLNLNWIGTRTIRGLRVAVEPGAPARRPTVLRLTWPGGHRTVVLDKKGRARFPPIRTDRMSVRITGAESAFSIDPDGVRSPLPVGIGEIRLRGLPYLPVSLSRDERTWNCGSGPTMIVNDVRIPTRLRASPAELFAMRPVPAEPCRTAPVRLRAGENAISVRASKMAVPATVRLGSSLGDLPVGKARTTSASPVERRYHPVAGAPYLATRENTNAGWEATQAGRSLTPVVVDGWQQGWLTDGSDDPVEASFAPDGRYRLGLAVGGVLFVVLLALLLVPRRRWPGADLPPLRPAVPTAWALLGLGFLGLGLLGRLVRSRALRGRRGNRRRARPGAGTRRSRWVAGALPVIAATAYFVRPWGSTNGWAGTLAWPHYLVLVAVSAVVAAGVERLPRLRSRMQGSSTTR